MSAGQLERSQVWLGGCGDRLDQLPVQRRRRQHRLRLGRDLQPQEVGLSTLPGGSATGTYTFAAPPSGVTAIDVYFANFPPFRDVPVSR